MVVINTNISAINARRALTKSDWSLNTSLERLSSGLRINSAKDDAAGLAISTRVDAIVRGQTVAIRNANDAISYIQTADKGLASISEILFRMRDLAVQSVNGTNLDGDRDSLNEEFTQLQSEINRITKQASFNSYSVFDGSQRVFHLSADSDSSQNISIKGLDLISNSGSTSTISKIALAAFESNGVTQSDVEKAKTSFINSAGSFDTSDGAPTGADSATLTTKIAQFEQNISADDLTTFTTKKNSFMSSGGNFSSADGSPVMAKTGTAVVNGVNTPVSTATDSQNYDDYVAAESEYFLAAKGNEIASAGSAATAILVIDRAINELGDERSKYGAYEAEINAVLDNLVSSNVVKSTQLSRIVDADYAHETAVFTRNQILQQAGNAMVTQANSSTKIVMDLLKGV